PDIRIVRIESDPPGAQVADQGVEVCMATPCEIYWRAAASKHEHKLTLAKRGFKNTTVTVAPDAEKVEAKLDTWSPAEIAALGAAQSPAQAKAEPPPTATAEAKTAEPAAPPPAAAAPTPPPQAAPAAVTQAPAVAPAPEPT